MITLSYWVFQTWSPTSRTQLATVRLQDEVINRISDATLTLEGKTHHLDPNFLNTHTLHGGHRGHDRRNWQITDHGPNFVDLKP